MITDRDHIRQAAGGFASSPPCRSSNKVQKTLSKDGRLEPTLRLEYPTAGRQVHLMFVNVHALLTGAVIISTDATPSLYLRTRHMVRMSRVR